ncbi:YeeE/YedE family protein [Virgibacillus pantothenticus]|uniref:YeeE/YedE family protein n=1 Tax=Virgibacillus pantothenticus TaxID=1473 RepID=UPI001C22E337|nr:YeeE/YedE family protein [Virgibacillus pantothenticus]MBU8564987.1 YeeE/YedE family protein [Virgibacillus pantothenticus]MBU8599294.1 YeeE/YedE family protein [Virgibacillus pantothenticus]MBU8633303.1 YeeE/YedE family protein [Virgibacillus pantothenticus]MBU8641036.1 YeeE/YedE family protein [Virgibacillus pantothenticus]MBU8645035.1 YeeE/YedE family protein [Virgibacillus pantothenticus]
MEAEIKKQQAIQSKHLQKIEYVLGIAAIFFVLILGNVLLKTDMLFFRLLIGTGLGYTLTRAYTGFAGSINRAYKTGSTKLLRAMALMFFITTLATTTFLLYSNPASYDLWINPINLGLIAGGLLFGFGMAFSSCCASGVLTDLATGFPRALITLLFFGMGIFIGFPIQHTASWITNSWFTTSVGNQLQGGVFLPDLFKWDGLGGYLGAILTTALFCGITVYLAYRYERKRKQQNRYIEHETEKMQELPNKFDSKDCKLFSQETYNRIFIKPWTLKQGAIVISILFVLLMGVTKAGWGASTPFGIWFGKLLMFLGVSPESIASFTKMSAEPFVLPFFEHPISVQNFGILVGTIIYLLTAGKMKTMFLEGAHIRKKEAALFALGGITMGLGTRLANGCNVGALFTPIANYSLSGWIFFLFLALGGIVGNMLAKRLF